MRVLQALAVDRLIFGREPESAVVDRIDRHAAVVAPSGVTGLRAVTDTGQQVIFSLHRPQGIVWRSSGITNRRAHRTAGDAIAQAYVAILIHSNATHPAEVGIRRKGSLLKQPEMRRCGFSQFVPPDARVAAACTRVDGMAHNHRLVIAQIAIGQTVHQPFAQRIQSLGSARLGDAIAPATRFRKRRHDDILRVRSERSYWNCSNLQTFSRDRARQGPGHSLRSNPAIRLGVGSCRQDRRAIGCRTVNLCLHTACWPRLR